MKRFTKSPKSVPAPQKAAALVHAVAASATVDAIPPTHSGAADGNHPKKHRIHPLIRCPYCLRMIGTIGVDVDAAVAVRPKHGTVDGSKLLVYGFHDAAGKPGCCPHVLHLGVDLEMTGPSKHNWLAENAACYIHPLIKAHEAACGRYCGLWERIVENACDLERPEDAERWAESLQQPFNYSEEGEAVAGDGWKLQACWWILVAADADAFLQEVAAMADRENPGFRPCLLTIPDGRESLRYYLPRVFPPALTTAPEETTKEL